jgi:hypothetical protein
MLVFIVRAVTGRDARVDVSTIVAANDQVGALLAARFVKFENDAVFRRSDFGRGAGTMLNLRLAHIL